MTHEQHLALDLIARLADRFGPASRIAKELPSWLEYLTEVSCPERPRTRPGIQWWNKVRTIARDLVPSAGGGEGEIVQRNASLFGRGFWVFMGRYRNIAVIIKKTTTISK